MQEYCGERRVKLLLWQLFCVFCAFGQELGERMSNWDDGVKNFVKKLFGDTNEKRVKALKPYVVRANSFADAFVKLSDDEL